MKFFKFLKNDQVLDLKKFDFAQLKLISNLKNIKKILRDDEKTRIHSEAYIIEISSIDLISTEFSKKNNFEAYFAWTIRLKKRNNQNIDLTLSCILDNIDPDFMCSSDSGEHLDSVCIENKDFIMNIGTEDTNMLGLRAERNDDMPQRFTSQYLYGPKQVNAVSYIKNGLKIHVPFLKEKENVYYQFVYALKKYKNENEILTHIAVDLQKTKLTSDLDGKNNFQNIDIELKYNFENIEDNLSKSKTKYKGLNNNNILKIEQYADFRLPDSYRLFLEIFGKEMKEGFLTGHSCFYDEIFNLKKWAKELLNENNSSLKLCDEDFVFLMSQGYQFCFFKLKKSQDPEVFYYREGEDQSEYIKIADSFSTFLWRFFNKDKTLFNLKKIAEDE